VPRSAVRLGLVGVGRWGRSYVSTIAGLEGAVLRAVASRNPATGALVPADCRVFEDWRDLVSCAGVDAVIVATPPTTHAEIAAAALHAGKPVLVEKPLTQSVRDLEQIRAALRDDGPTVFVEHTHLHHPAFVRLREEAAARGAIRAIRSSAGNHGPYRADVPVLWDWGPHDIAMCLALRDAPLVPTGAERLEHRLIAGALAERVRLRLCSGEVAATVTLSTLDDKHRWFAVDLDAATLIYSDQLPAKLSLHDGPGASPADAGRAIVVRDERPLRAALLEFVAAVRKGSTGRDSFVLGERVVECLAQCQALLEADAKSPARRVSHRGYR